MLSEQEKIQNIYNLLNLSPEEVNTKIFSMRGITIANKLKIMAACLNDQKALDLENKDPKNRNNKIKKAGQSLQEVVAKSRIKLTL